MNTHPETANKPLISVAIQSVLISQFNDELKFGTKSWPDGTTEKLRPQLENFADAAQRAAADGALTWNHLMLSHAYQVASTEDAGDLYMALAGLARTAVQWMESLNDQHGGV